MSTAPLLDSQLKLLSTLNDRQKEAVQSITNATLVIAGAGSGKTAVLTRRVAFLIAGGTTPGNILCLTFTNKAAGEMNKRVRTILEDIGVELPFIPLWREDYLQNPLLCTFHSLGVRLLREFGDRINLKKEFTILDSEDQKKIIRQILKDLNVNEKTLQPSLALYFISQCKQELLVAAESRRITKEFLPVFHQVYKKYEDILKSNHNVDFDDLLLLPHRIMSENADVLEILRQRWHHIMIDEFQDTNQAQFEIARLLCPGQILENDVDRSLFVVGDDAQSIYAFRGSKIEIILNFHQDYPGCKEIVLNQNYRSTQPILDLAEKVLSHNPKQKKKELFTQNPEKIDVSYYLAKNERDEAEYIIKQIYQHYVTDELDKKLTTHSSQDNEISLEPENFFDHPTMFQTENQKNETKFASRSNDPISSMFDIYLDTDEFKPSSLSNYQPTSWNVPTYDWSKLEKLNDCVVLYRTHSQSRSLEEAFLKHRLPYRLVSGTRFLDRKEIRDVFSILRYLANGEDSHSLSRFLPLILDGVGPKTLDKILAYLQDFEYPLPPKYQQQIMELLSKIQATWQNHDTLIELTKDLLASTGYFRYLKTEYPNKDEYEARIENIGEIYSLMFPFDEDKTVSLQERLSQFLTQISLMSQLDNDDKDKSPKLNLMSLHQSKGLEFETVFLVGVEDGLLPHSNSFFEANGIEEEVRLAYVGVTRAKKYLHLISADSRIQFGQIKANPVSRIFRPFLDTHARRRKN